MRRWKLSDAATAVFFFAIAGFFALSFFVSLSDTMCTLDSPKPCSILDMDRRTYDLPLTAGVTVLFFGLGLRMFWGMRRGE